MNKQRFSWGFSWGFSLLFLGLLFAVSLQGVFAQEDGADADTTDDTSAHTVFLPLIGDPGEGSIGVGPNFLEGTNQIIVRYGEAIQAAALDQAAQAQALSEVTGREIAYVRAMSDNAIVVKLPQWVELSEAATVAQAMLGVPNVVDAEPDQIMQIAQTPNDPSYGQQWHYFSPPAASMVQIYPVPGISPPAPQVPWLR